MTRRWFFAIFASRKCRHDLLLHVLAFPIRIWSCFCISFLTTISLIYHEVHQILCWKLYTRSNCENARVNPCGMRTTLYMAVWVATVLRAVKHSKEHQCICIFAVYDSVCSIVNRKLYTVKIQMHSQIKQNSTYTVRLNGHIMLTEKLRSTVM